MVKKSTDTPGRASGVSSGVSSRSIAASHLQAMTEVANPVSLSAAARAHFMRARRDHDARRAHAEGLGERVVDENAAYLHAATISYVGAGFSRPWAA